jgi:hypothetical protein
VSVEGGSVDQRDVRAIGSMRMDYSVPDKNWLKLFMSVSQEYVDSNIDPAAYTSMELSVGLFLCY